LFEEQLKRKPTNLTSKQRFVAYCPTFPSLKKNPQLLGATKLLQGMYDHTAHQAWLERKTAPPCDVLEDGEGDAGSLTSSQFQAERKRSFVDTILHKVLDAPATKITSVMLMNRYVFIYISINKFIHACTLDVNTTSPPINLLFCLHDFVNFLKFWQGSRPVCEAVARKEQ
jgi:hypothetical protein